MVRAYVISTVGNSNFASVVLNDISPTKTYYSPNTNEIKDFGNNFHRYLRKCDIYVAVIDSNIINNNFLLLQLRYAKDYAQKHSNKLFIPIILDNSRVPISLDRVDFYTYNTKTKEKSFSGDLPGHTSLNEKLKMLSIKRSQSTQMLLITFAIEILAISFIIVPIDYMDYKFGDAMVFFGVSILFLAMVTLFISYSSLTKSNWKTKKEYESRSYSERLKEAIITDKNIVNKEEKSVGRSYIDALELMTINLEDIKEYYRWSSSQAKITFFVAIGMCILGFVLIFSAIVIQFLKEPNIKVSILAAIGGIVTEFVSGTIFVIYRYSLSQLNHYHKALHEDERFLSSVTLLVKFNSEETKDEMLKEIIKAEIEMNLEGLKEPNKYEADKLNSIKNST